MAGYRVWDWFGDGGVAHSSGPVKQKLPIEQFKKEESKWDNSMLLRSIA